MILPAALAGIPTRPTTERGGGKLATLAATELPGAGPLSSVPSLQSTGQSEAPPRKAVPDVPPTTPKVQRPARAAVNFSSDTKGDEVQCLLVSVLYASYTNCNL